MSLRYFSCVNLSICEETNTHWNNLSMGLWIENHLMKWVVIVKRLSKELLGTVLRSEAPTGWSVSVRSAIDCELRYLRSFNICYISAVSHTSKKLRSDFHIFTWDTWFHPAILSPRCYRWAMTCRCYTCISHHSMEMALYSWITSSSIKNKYI